MSLCAALCATAPVLAADAAWADPGKDESGKGQWRTLSSDRTNLATGHLPPPGECRVWRYGIPAGHQSSPFRCEKKRGREIPVYDTEASNHRTVPCSRYYAMVF